MKFTISIDKGDLAEWPDRREDYWVGTCAETGSVVTADSEAMAAEMMLELLSDEVASAIKTGNWANLFWVKTP